MKITIDTDEIELAVRDAGQVIVTADGEKPILTLLKYQALIEQAIEDAKRVVEERAKALNKNLQTVVADNIKVMYRAYGAQYTIDESQLAYVPRNLFRAEMGIVLDDKLPQDIIDQLKALGAKVKETKYKGVVKKDITFVVNKKEVDKYIDEYKGQFPAGIIENDRAKKLSFKLKDEDEDRPEVG